MTMIVFFVLFIGEKEGKMNNVKMILEKYGKDTIWFYLKDDKN